MALELWTQRDLVGIRKDMKLEGKTDFWRNTFFKGRHFSRHKEIHFGEISGHRIMAPFALPSSMGKPIMTERGAKLESFTPGYIKLLDAVRPEEATTVTPMEILEGTELSIDARFDARTAEISLEHVTAIHRTWDWLAARAVIDGRVEIKYHADQGMPYPSVIIDFGRSPSHTVAFGTGADWTSPTADIFDDVQGFIDTARKSKFGGNLTQMFVGANVAPVFAKNKSVIDKLDTQLRGGEGTQFTRGLQFYNDDQNAPTWLGRLGGAGGSIDVYAYSDQQYDADGNVHEVLNPNDVLLTAPGVDGLMAFGAIYDLDAIGNGSGSPTDLFQKQYKQDNPSQLNLLSQSAPLPIPRFPNRTFKATVLS